METNSRARLILKYLTPSILSYLSIFLFTVVDGIFVGQGVGADALGAVNIAFPFILIFTACTMLSTIGGLTITAIRIGRGDTEGANEVFMHSFTLTLLIDVVFCAASVIFTVPICRLLGANDSYVQMTQDYLFWYGVFLIPCGLCINLDGFIRNDGRPSLVSIKTIIATTLNIFGDWLLIFPLGLGIKGAAIATGVAQTVSLLIGLSHFILKKGNLTFHKFRINKWLYGKIILRGLPECVAQFCTPVETIITNFIIVENLGNPAENAYSIICYVACFAISMTSGTAEGLQPLFGQSYGARNERNLKFFKRAGFIIGLSGAVIITIIVNIFSATWCYLYAADPATTEVAMRAFPLYSWGYAVQGVTLITSSYLYSTTRTKYALIINILRSFVVDSLVTLIMPAVFGADSIWLTFGIFEGIVACTAFVFMQIADRNGAIGKTLE